MTALQHIEKAFELLNAIPVRGGDVDLMAVARRELGKAYQLLAKEESDG